MGRLHLGAVAVVAMVFAGSSVAAQTRRHDPYQYGSRSNANAAYDNGYRQGLEEGRNDARRNRPYDYRDRDDYRRGDWGWDRRSGDRDWYRNEFRRGFEVGYRDGYGRNANRRYSTGSRYPGSYGSSGRYGYGGYGGQALQYGFSDGYQKGLEDIRDRDRYDPTRHGWYRSGDRHYDRRYGSKDVYRDEYRRGFLEGYDRAFRGGTYR